VNSIHSISDIIIIFLKIFENWFEIFYKLKKINKNVLETFKSYFWNEDNNYWVLHKIWNYIKTSIVLIKTIYNQLILLYTNVYL